MSTSSCKYSKNPTMRRLVVDPAIRGELDYIFVPGFPASELYAMIPELHDEFPGEEAKVGRWLSKSKPRWKVARDKCMPSLPAKVVTPGPKAAAIAATNHDADGTPESAASDDTDTKLAKIKLKKDRLATEAELQKQTEALLIEAKLNAVGRRKDAKPELKANNDLMREMAQVSVQNAKENKELREKLVENEQKHLDSASVFAAQAQKGTDLHVSLIRDEKAAEKDLIEARMESLQTKKKEAVITEELGLLQLKVDKKEKKKENTSTVAAVSEGTNVANKDGTANGGSWWPRRMSWSKKDSGAAAAKENVANGATTPEPSTDVTPEKKVTVAGDTAFETPRKKAAETPARMTRSQRKKAGLPLP